MDWEELKRELLRDPNTRREYDSLEAEHQLARSIIGRRIAKRMTQAQLATKAGTKQPVISRLESGNSKPSLALLQRVSGDVAATITSYEVDRRVNNSRAIDPRDASLIEPEG